MDAGFVSSGYFGQAVAKVFPQHGGGNQMTSTLMTLLIVILINTIFWLGLYIRMAHYVRTHGGRLTLFSFNLMFPVIAQYRKLYGQEIAPGSNLFPLWLISVALNLLLIVILILTVFLAQPVVPY